MENIQQQFFSATFAEHGIICSEWRFWRHTS